MNSMRKVFFDTHQRFLNSCLATYFLGLTSHSLNFRDLSVTYLRQFDSA